MPDQQISEWDQTQQTFNRMDMILLKIDEALYKVGQRDNNALEPYYAGLKVLWLETTALVNSETLKKEINNMFSQVRNELNKWLKNNQASSNKIFQVHIADILQNLHEKIMYTRQKLGLGIRTYAKKSKKTKIKEALGVKSG